MTKIIHIPSPQLLKVRKKKPWGQKNSSLPHELQILQEKCRKVTRTSGIKKPRPVQQQNCGITFFFPTPSEHEEMGDSVTVRVDSHVMKSALHPGQDIQVQSKNQHGKVHDRPIPQHYQWKTPPHLSLKRLPKSKLIGPSLKKLFPSKWWKEKTGFRLAYFSIPQLPFSCGNF